ncbi:MAG: hypothetical protein ALAOOOJD_03190 [bacterium]|nr:hypothetical protein [bacterium]
MCFALKKDSGMASRLVHGLLALCLALPAAGKTLPSLKPSLDVAQFQDKTQRAYLEIYYALPAAAVTYVPANNGKELACQLLLSLQVYRDRTLWAAKLWKIEKSHPDTLPALARPQQLVDVVSYLLDAPGQYRMTLLVKDLHQPDRLDSTSAEITVREFNPEKVEISDVELAASIKPSSAATAAIFKKHQQEIVPNAAALFGENAANLYYYFEAYHLLKNLPGEKYKVFGYVQTPDGKMNAGAARLTRTRKKTVDASVEMGMLSIGALPSGKYRLIYGIADSTETVLASRWKEFYVYNPAADGAPSPAADVASTTMIGPLQELNEKMLDDEFAKMLLIAGVEERKFYKNLVTANAKREFIASLWQSAQSDAALTSMAYRQQYLARAAEAGTRFKSPLRPGWKSDRGRAFILYGAPNHLERFPSSTTTLPYEVWSYDNLKGQGGVQFIFADRTGFGNYEQIHSTLQGELQDPNWQNLIARGSGNESLLNANGNN